MNRWLIIVGMVVIVGMLVIAAFSVGVYVGEHGWTSGGLRYQPRGHSPPKGDSPPARPGIPGLPPGPPQIIGRLQVKSSKTILLDTRNGPRHIALTPETRFMNSAGDDLNLEDLQIGDILGVFGRYDPAAGVFQAEIVLRLPPKP